MYTLKLRDMQKRCEPTHFEVVVKHCFSTSVVSVSYSLGYAELVSDN